MVRLMPDQTKRGAACAASACYAVIYIGRREFAEAGGLMSYGANIADAWREIDGFRIYVLHILAELDPQTGDNVDAVIYGHSHQPKIETKNGTLFFNPGSAGPRRFRLPITVGRMTAEHGKLRAEIVELSVKR
jgi:hypothetical protein